MNILNKSQIQILAIVAMAADHCAFLMPDRFLYYLCHIIGRMTIIIMSFFVAEGYFKTHNIHRYIIRMGIFALISQLPFYLYGSAQLPQSLHAMLSEGFRRGSVIFTLFIGLCMLTVIKSHVKPVLKLAAVCFALFLTYNSDWGWVCLLWVALFGKWHGQTQKQIIAGVAVLLLYTAVRIADGIIGDGDIIWAFVQLGGLLAFPLLYLYNGEKGNAPKFAFYIFYPLHLLILYFAELAVF